jgi:hypothetical protein
VFKSPHLAGSSNPTLHLINDEQDTVAITDRAQAGEGTGWWYNVPTFALNWLNDNCRDFFGRSCGFKQGAFDQINTGNITRWKLKVDRTAVTIRVVRMTDAG